MALSWERGSVRDELFEELVKAWLARDVRAGLLWIHSLSDVSDRNRAGTAAINYLAQSDPASALELALALGFGVSDGSLEHKVQLWTEERPAEAVAWVLSLPQGPNRDLLLARVVSVRAQHDPAGAAELAVYQLSPGQGRDEALLSVVQRWAASDPEAAGRWVARLPAGALYDRAINLLAATPR